LAKLNFTKTSLARLRPSTTGKRTYYYDRKVRGLALAVTPAGTKTFLLYRKIGGRPERITIGRFPDLSVEQARGAASTLNGQIALGINPQERRRALHAETTLGSLFEQYLERHAKVHKRSWMGDQDQFLRFLSRWRNRKLSSIRKVDIETVLAKVGRENGHYAANRLLALLHFMFKKGIEWGWDRPNPAHGIRKFKEKSRTRFIEADEMPRFFAALAEEGNETVRDYVLVSLLTGARRANVQSMRWDQINFERATWTIPVTKSGDPHTVPLAPEAVRILQARNSASGNEWVFPGRGRTGHIVEPKSAWRRILERAGIEDLRLHDLRRTLGSWQAATGANLSIIGRTLDHKSVTTTAIYARLNLDPVRQSVNTATAAILSAANPTRGSHGEIKKI